MTRVYSQELTRVQPLVLDGKTNEDTKSVYSQNLCTICDAN
jgi:hypothetical protein